MKLWKFLTSGMLLALLLAPFVLQAQELAWPVPIRLQDFETRTLGSETLNGHRHLIIQADTHSPGVAKRLGYSRVTAWFDTVDKTTRKVILLNAASKPLLTMRFFHFQRTNGVLRVSEMEVRDHLKQQTHHFKLNNGKSFLATMMQTEKNHQGEAKSSARGIGKEFPRRLNQKPTSDKHP